MRPKGDSHVCNCPEGSLCGQAKAVQALPIAGRKADRSELSRIRTRPGAFFRRAEGDEGDEGRRRRQPSWEDQGRRPRRKTKEDQGGTKRRDQEEGPRGGTK